VTEPAAALSPQASVAEPSSAPQHTAPTSILLGLLTSVQNAVLPFAAITFSTGGTGLLGAILVGIAIVIVGTVFAYFHWKRLTYTIGAQDIRVESGVLSRAARSVPYERIQDVSLEQKFLARLLGLVAVKFETGAGGGEDLSLAFLTEERGEELRRLVRERRDEAEPAVAHKAGVVQGGDTTAEADGEVLFAMGPRRLFTFGLFEFSLAVFAVLGGLAQYLDMFGDFEVWDPDNWQGLIERYGLDFRQLDRTMQGIGAALGLIALLIVGSLTGMVRVFLREWNFLLERTARGFRRRRGLLTRTDVVMPIHRVQGLSIGTRFIRYRFGWHNLKFVSLARDAGSSSHVVVPFGQIDEIEPVVEAAGFSLPAADTDWHRASSRYRGDAMIIDSIFFFLAAAGFFIAHMIDPATWKPLVGGALFAVGLFAMFAAYYSWRFKRHALGREQIMARDGLLSPETQIATRLKLHSVEIAQGPIARLRGYATLRLGQAGGTFAIPGIPIERAREVRRQVVATIAATDFSRLESQQASLKP
jgi:putative membrane protein